MPFDPSAHLASQGWAGRGEPLRPNSNGLRKPIILSQKKTLGGVGKDRDTSFAFWDHVYAASSQAISIKLHNDSDTEDDPATLIISGGSSLRRTHTGLLSNLPPLHHGITPTSSGGSTPTLLRDGSDPPSHARMSLLSIAKKEAAKRGLYTRFLRGPILGSSADLDTAQIEQRPMASTTSTNEELVDDETFGESSTSGASAFEAKAMHLDESAHEAARAAATPRMAAKGDRQAKLDAKRLRKEERRQRRLLKRATINQAPNASSTATGDSRPPTSPSVTATAGGARPSKKRKVDSCNDLRSADAGVSTTEPKKKRRKKMPSMGDGHEDSRIEQAYRIATTSEAPKEKASSEAAKGRKPPRKVKFSATVEQRVVSRWL